MNFMDDIFSTKDRIAELEAQIKKHNQLYYDQDAPEISDPEYDELKAELERLNPTSSVLNELGASTFGEKYEHATVMGSLSKCHSAKEVFEKFKGIEVVLMPKIDGCSLCTHFQQSLILAATRGDGHIGEKVTPNAVVISNMPAIIQLHSALEVRGEAYIAKSDFYGTMDQPGYGGKPNGLANPRNAAAGSLRQKEPTMTRERKVRFVAYEMFYEIPANKHSDKLEALKICGFETPPYKVVVCDSEETIQAAIDEIKAMDAIVPYETDGVVIRINQQSIFDSQGFSGKCPKGALAYKFETVKAGSKILDIEWSTSRTGRLCPVAIIVPTRISGSLVTRITLNNTDWIDKVDVAIDDEILFEKANEIIPKLVSVLKRAPNRNNINYPVNCPSCGHAVVNDYCINPQCPAQFQAAVIHILEKLKIRGIAESTVEKVVNAGLVKKPFEIFDLTEADLKSIGFGDRQSEIICEAISNPEATKAYILACLGIDGWGRRMFESLSKYVPLDDVITETVSVQTLAGTAGVGSIRANALVNGIKDKRELLDGLLSRIKVKADLPVGITLKGLTFCITGSLSKPRGEVQTDIINAGGEIKGSVSSKLNYLVVGDEAGSKLTKAEALGVKTISEEELYSWIEMGK